VWVKTVPILHRVKKKSYPLALLPWHFALITESGKQSPQLAGHRALFGQPTMPVELQPTINLWGEYFRATQ
jgi:hypothetical protein